MSSSIRELVESVAKNMCESSDNPGERLDRIEKKFIDEAKKIGKKYDCFYDAMRDDNALYINLQPAMDFSKEYKDGPTQHEMVEEFKKFRSELDELAQRLGCKEVQYICDPNEKSISAKDDDGRDYMNFLCTSVKKESYA